MNLPALHGNWVDLIILLVVLFSALDGLRKGLWLGTLNLASFAISFAAALKFYSFFGRLLVDNFSLPPGISNAIGFLAAGFLAQTAMTFLTSLLLAKYQAKIEETVAKKHVSRSLNRLNSLLGVLPAIGEAAVTVAFFFTLLVALPIQGSVKKDIVSSKLGGPIVRQTLKIEQQLNSIFGQAVDETLNFITINPGSSERVALHFTQTDVTVDQAAENVMFNLVNQARKDSGLLPLALDPRLRTLAEAYAKDMFARGYFSHYNPEGQSPFDRMRAAGISFTAAGENLALAPNVYLAEQGLLNSPGHRANILSPDFGHLGVGAIDGGIYGELFVQEFTN